MTSNVFVQNPQHYLLEFILDAKYTSCIAIIGDAQSQAKRDTLVQQYLVVFTVFESM